VSDTPGVSKRAGGRDWYLPHRAIIALGAILIVIAVSCGALSLVNETNAVVGTTTLNNTYLSLLAPARVLRSSVATFQALAETAYAGAPPSATFLASAVQASDATDHDYAIYKGLLDRPGSGGVPSDLTSTMAAYVTARAKLADYVDPGSTPDQRAVIVAAERQADQNVDAAIGRSQDTVTDLVSAKAVQARDAAEAARLDLLLCVILGGITAIGFTSLFAYKALRVERDDDRRNSVRARATRRNEFESRLQRALEMAKSDAAVYGLVGEALAESAPDLYSELLVADSGTAHFQQVLNRSDAVEGSGCGVISPEDCPAASRGQTMVFPRSTAIDACPNLRGRGCSAVCIPVTLGGDSVGVFHVTAAEGAPPSEEVRQDVFVISRRASERLAMLRAFEVSEGEANSDSLTGLMTRRSLERSTKELQESGELYSIAYADLDHFKQLNDVFGHDAGDRALRAFSQVLRDSVRPADIPCRYGGEEFVIVLPDCQTTEAVQVLERVRHRLADRLAAGKLPGFTVSFGVATSDQAPTFHDVVDMADQALLRAKGDGRDRIVIATEATGMAELPLTGHVV
jgi:diguanylate cyclase (GGDEF)-like protein